MDKKAWILSKRYTDETAAQFGGLKGAPCQVSSVEKINGQNIVTLEWKNNDGETRETKVYIDDGTPIYTWTSGDDYKYGDLVIYESCFYRCITPNDDVVFDDTKWNEIGSPDGNYDIVENSSLLPARFTAADRKMYFAIEEGTFFLWNGTRWVKQFIVDDELDANSTNALQNKVIYNELNKKQNKLTAGEGITITDDIETNEVIISGNSMTHEELNEMWKEPGNIILSKSIVDLTVGESDVVTILDATGIVNINVEDESIATAILSGLDIDITSVSEGETRIKVISNPTITKREKVGYITVTVHS